MSSERESRVQEKTMAIIRKFEGYVYKNAQNLYTEKGRPDLTACIPITLKQAAKLFGEDATIGLFVGVELKRKGHLDEVSPAQTIVGNKIKKAGGLWLAIDEPELIEALLLRFKGE